MSAKRHKLTEFSVAISYILLSVLCIVIAKPFVQPYKDEFPHFVELVIVFVLCLLGLRGAKKLRDLFEKDENIER